MKKLIGVMLALLIAVTGFAFAEGAGSSAKTADGYLLIRFEQDDAESLALIGTGDGTDIIKALTAEGESYSAQFDRLWNALALLQPATVLEGSIANLGFEPGYAGNTLVTLNGVTVAQLKGAEAFAILPGEERPSVRTGCSVRLWTAEATENAGEICVNCGRVNDGSDAHDDEISQFCDLDHTECMGDPTHHCDSCGKDYPCSKSNSHTECAVCAKPWCDKSEGDHAALECGHRGCAVYGNEAAHELCAICGGYLCDGEDHTAAECGNHHAADPGNHSLCENGDGYLCDGKNHSHADEIPEGDVIVEGDAARA